MAGSRDSQWVAIVDDDARVREALVDLLEEAGFSVQAFQSAEDFLDSRRRHECSCVIADIRMPGMSGLDLQARLNAEPMRTPMIFITAQGGEHPHMQALRRGAADFLQKPFDHQVLLNYVRAAVQR